MNTGSQQSLDHSAVSFSPSPWGSLKPPKHSVSQHFKQNRSLSSERKIIFYEHS